MISKIHCDLKYFFGFKKIFGIVPYRLPYVVDVVAVVCFKLTPFDVEKLKILQNMYALATQKICWV